MSKFKISKGVVPPKPRRTGRKPLYPFREMEVGDSFYVSAKGFDNDTRVAQISVTACARNWGNQQYPKKTFTTRQIKNRGVRVWRVS